jgi:tetratricopeptide (TPR) repeat protein
MKSLWQIKTLLLLVFGLFPLNPGLAGGLKMPEETAMINCFFKNLYNFSFSSADSVLQVINSSDMDEVTKSNINANMAWWKLLSGENIESNLEICDSSINESISSALRDKHRDINSLLNVIYSYSLKARLENYRGKTLRSLIYFYKSITYVEKCIGRPERDEKLDLVLGIYYYFIDYIESEYFMTRAMFISFPKGDKIKGLKYLETCAASLDEMIRTEANYFLLKIYSYLEKDFKKAYISAEILTRLHPNNLVYSVEQYKLLLKMKKQEEAQLFRRKLIEEIHLAKNINGVQKNHFMSQLDKPGLKL